LKDQIDFLKKSNQKYKARISDHVDWIIQFQQKFESKRNMWEKTFQSVKDMSMTEDEVEWLQADHEKMLDLLKQEVNQSVSASNESNGKKRKSSGGGGSRSDVLLAVDPAPATASSSSSSLTVKSTGNIESLPPRLLILLLHVTYFDGGGEREVVTILIIIPHPHSTSHQ
jgi:hypothetical protein